MGRNEDLMLFCVSPSPCYLKFLPLKALQLHGATAEVKVMAGSTWWFVTPGLGSTLRETELLLDVRKQEHVLSITKCDSQPPCALIQIHTSPRSAMRSRSKVH